MTKKVYSAVDVKKHVLTDTEIFTLPYGSGFQVRSSNLYFLGYLKFSVIAINMNKDQNWSVNQLLGTKRKADRGNFFIKKINTSSTLEQT
jgi:hypothetical protein